MKAIAGIVVGAAALLAAAGCGSSQPAPAVFTPAGGGQSTAASPAGGGSQPAGGAAASYVMPPFGKNVHIEMTSWLPRDPAQARAVIADKNYQLAFLYAEYKGGQDQSWLSYVAPVMQGPLSATLRSQNVTTESFTGTIKYFGMRVFPDPTVRGDLDVASCFDNAGSSNTNLRTGAVLPDSTPANQHYMLITDQLAKNTAGEWQVVANFQAVYYPRAKECKP